MELIHKHIPANSEHSPGPDDFPGEFYQAYLLSKRLSCVYSLIYEREERPEHHSALS